MTDTKTLLSELANGPLDHFKPCRASSLAMMLDAPAQEKLSEALAGKEWPAARLAALMTSHGMKVSSSAINNHRRGDCSCSR